jgi:putative copper export protein
LTLASFTLMGHTATHSLRWMLAVFLLVHLFVSAFWFGSLTGFWITSVKEEVATNGAIVRRFSAIAGWLVPLILIAGVAMAIALLPDFDALTSTYGLLILAKLFGFIALMILATWNKFRIGPAISQGSAAALATFRRVVAAEWLLIASVLGLTAVMTGLFSPD